MLIYALIICVITSITSKLLVISTELQLQLVNVVFRHGDRAPTSSNESYPNDPYLHSDYLIGPGELTNAGRTRCETLGKHLHGLYSGFSGDSYVPEEIEACSTSENRTEECLKLALCAWYSKDRQLQDSVEGCQPNINVINSTVNTLLRPKKSQSFREEKRRIKQLPEVQNQINSYKELMENLTRLTGKKIKTVLNILQLYNTLTCQSSQNWQLPAWARDMYPTGILSRATILHYQLDSWDQRIRRVNGGRLLRKMVDQMLSKVENHGINKTKIYLYSAHEGNVASALMTLGVYNPPHVPKYTSAVIIELLNRDHDYYVRVRYYKGIPTESTIKTIPGCMELCPFQQFIKLIEDNLASSEEV